VDIQSTKTTPAALLSDGNDGGVYVVPPFQRSYEWTNEQWDDLWDDLILLRQGHGEHFMGPVVLTSKFEDDRPPEPYASFHYRYVIDGQQRLVTVSILLSLLSERLASVENAPGWEADLDTSLRVDATRSYKLLDNKINMKPPRLLLNEELPRKALADALKADLVHDAGLPEGTADAADNIRNCRVFFAEKLEAELGATTPAEQLVAVRELIKAVRDRFEFIAINLNSEEDAYTIFESFNAKGRELSRADLVKNLLMGYAHRAARLVGSKEIERRVADYWAEAAKDIEAGGHTLGTFLRHFWIAKEGREADSIVRMDDLYQRIRTYLRLKVGEFKEAPSASRELAAFGEELEEAASRYAWLWGPAGQPEPYKTAKDALVRCRLYLEGMKVFGVTQALPVLLAALLNDVELADFERLCASFERAAVLRSLAKLPANEIERQTRGWCAQLRESPDKIAAVTNIVAKIDALADSAAARDPFVIGQLKAAQSRHVLLRIENHERRAKPTEEIVSATVELEHIYPRSPKAGEWPEWSDDDAKLVNRLGNLALLGPRANRMIKNGRFWCGAAQPTLGKGKDAPIRCCKRHVYQASTILHAVELTQAEYETWTPTAMNERHASLAARARNVWPSLRYPA
jgi:hypothetical protein